MFLQLCSKCSFTTDCSETRNIVTDILDGCVYDSMVNIYSCKQRYTKIYNNVNHFISIIRVVYKKIKYIYFDIRL